MMPVPLFFRREGPRRRRACLRRSLVTDVILAVALWSASREREERGGTGDRVRVYAGGGGDRLLLYHVRALRTVGSASDGSDCLSCCPTDLIDLGCANFGPVRQNSYDAKTKNLTCLYLCENEPSFCYQIGAQILKEILEKCPSGSTKRKHQYIDILRKLKTKL